MGLVDVLVIGIHVGGPTGAIWLIKLGLVKLTIIAAGGLMAGGAVTAKIAHQREERRLSALRARRQTSMRPPGAPQTMSLVRSASNRVRT